MKETYWLILILILGIICIAFINFFQTYTNTDEQNYMLLKEVTEASMYDAIDMNAYKLHGQLRINREKFVESFVRRFAESVNQDRNYKIRVIDFNETPPKVSIQVGSSTVATFAGDSFDIVTKVDGILETKYYEDRLLKDVVEE